MPTKKQLENRISMLNDALEVALAVSPERDNNFFTGGLSDAYTTRNEWDRKKVFAESLRAWRVNPIARRIVRLYIGFILGKGIKITCKDKPTQDFLDKWWKTNQLKRNTKRWLAEDVRTGNLFILFNLQADGMTILRAVPAENIENILTEENDIETETGYSTDPTDDITYPAYQAGSDQTKFMKHYTSNQPVGSPWGEGDLPPLLVWIGRFSSWLEDRVRLNKFRTAFVYAVRGTYKSETERKTREKELNANPPKSGSILVLNGANGEDWGILAPQLDSFNASVDGIAIKKMILDGAGQPLHWHAEPEDGMSTTAEAAGTPTFRTLEEMQDETFDKLLDMARTALEMRAQFDRNIQPDIELRVDGPDITERDNASLALALGRAYPQLADLFDREGIDDKEFLRLTYKMFAEVWQEKKTPKIKRKPLTQRTPAGQIQNPQSDPADQPEDDN